ncbi:MULTISPECIES: porin [Paraburkholderia]|uniref:porin n=1 Tax=Paraburkholderia TaxID=1822464 RepID=UPI00190B0CA1|nr:MULTISPECIES: porin [Paraburkholderia]MBK3841525.1 porin [Paraburkholderia aspalathi]MCX4159000.1 porin [Paraburkholderia aspalathi]MDN7168399.1 porin [Paraburkholderia sp. SECH2]MDQ6396886.1 porin [Paraburkholderia aspalathi]CAE6806902.1 Outer membrane porin protein [Paraburkholderia aspalathi]
MNKALATTLVALAGTFGAAAHAQSSVTLYGTLDTGIDYISNQKTASGGKSNWMMESGNISTDRWGLRGNEDLGGGLSAVFDLENGFNIDSGKFSNGGDEFGRQAWVGIASKQWGTVTMGRQYDFLVDFVAPLSATGSGFGGNIADHPFDNDNLNNDLRMNNALKFRSATYDGFTVGGAYAFSNAAGGFSNNNAYSLGAQWAGGPFNLALAYLQVNQPGGVNQPANTGGAVSSSDGDATFTGVRQRILGAAGRYTFGAATVGLVFTRTMLDDPHQITQGGAYATLNGDMLTFNNYELNARYAITPAFTLGGSYTFTDGHFSDDGRSVAPKWNQFMLQADYALSRRTDLYLEGVYQHVSGADGIAVLGNASIYSLAASSSDRQAVVAVGIRHKF